MSNMQKKIRYFALCVITMAVGLASRQYASYLPRFIHIYVGDILWALMMYWGIRFLFTKLSVSKAVMLGIGLSWLVEISQLYQAPWITSLRRTWIGWLILGHGFLWSDLICYTAGILAGALIDRLMQKYL